ncbi:cytochrome ubiquinol oxidase subunit I [candidate division KSB1 bacterium]|nr:cytochrome ubiquinol oxidase subunit I [candidate division KSB1 bacterium]
MDPLLLARLQFAVTTVYHFFFVPLTLGLSILVAIMESIYVKTGDESYKRMARFWGTLFLINFAMGVVTGIVQEFQFGMNWSEYSRFIGDIFGVPLAIEALLAFFLESVFLGVWIFGWNRLSKKMHAASIWLVAVGSNLSALWILVANSFMQQPVGYTLRNGRAEMTNFWALLTNRHVWEQFPHVVFAGVCTAAFFVIGISAWHLRKKSTDSLVWLRSLKMGTIYGAVGILFVILIGHNQAQYMIKVQPMKMAAAEALWESENPAAMSLFTICDEKHCKDIFSIKIPRLLSLLAHNRFIGEVKGINQLQEEFQAAHGPGDYIPPVALSYWTFRLMIGAGMLMLLLIFLLLIGLFRAKVDYKAHFLRLLTVAIALPYIANSAGWIFTEIARQPWIVYGIMRTEDGISPNVGGGAVLLSLILFTLVYGALLLADVYLLRKYAMAGTDNLNDHE